MADVEVYGKLLSTLPADDDHPYRSGAWRPQHVEYDADDLDVQGELPDDLYGVYLRNTENPLHPAIARYHPFDGDGMIHKVSFRTATCPTGTASSGPTACRPSRRPAARCGPASRSIRTARSGRMAGVPGAG